MIDKRLRNYVDTLLRRAKEASLRPYLSTDIKNKILLDMALSLSREKNYILAQNKKDVSKARRGGKTKSFIDRLLLDDKRIELMASSLQEIASLKDPVGTIISSWRRPNGLVISKVRVPLGVLLIIYEARPNVTSDCIGLCLKSSNISILRGGSDSLYSNKAIFGILNKSLKKYAAIDSFMLIDLPEHKIVDYILKKGEGFIDLVIPRGGEELIRKVASRSSVPVIKHYKGICHIYVDEYADLKKALSICINAKVQRPSVCNAVETILVHKNTAEEFLPVLAESLKRHSVELRGDIKTLRILPGIKKAKDKDWREEYLDLIVSIKVVENIDQAIEHINTYGSLHTDSIISQNDANIKKFTERVQSACVFSNISTRFSDGKEFGLGAEIGISTDKLHARGPMGLEELTTYKYVVYGSGQIRT